MVQAVELRSERLLRPMELVRQRGLPKTRIYTAVSTGELRHVRFGRAILIRESDLDAWLDRYSRGGDGVGNVAA